VGATRALGGAATVKVLYEGVRTPTPPSERRAWLCAVALCLLGAGVLAAILSGAVGSSSGVPAAAPPAVLVDVATPTAASGAEAALRSGAGTAAGPYAAATAARHGRTASGGSAAAGAGGESGAPATGGTARTVDSVGAVVADPPSAEWGGPGGGSTGQTEVNISAAWEAGFYPIYAEAQRVFGVNWLLLASIHRQESAFSTASTTYHGLNFAGCCGGPMQFNVTNGGAGIPSTWDLVRNAYRFGTRPAVYDHRTAHHPSIYDDYDSIMAATWLLYSDGAGAALNDSAWWAAYDYYGHDAYGVEYADEVLARAIGWSQHGFCINCGVEGTMVQAVYEAYGAPVMATYTAATTAREHAKARLPSTRRADPTIGSGTGGRR
jgi:hypothetical protein